MAGDTLTSIIENLRDRTDFLTLNLLAEILHCHTQTLYKSCAQGKTPHLRIGGRIKFDPSTIATFSEKRSWDPSSVHTRPEDACGKRSRRHHFNVRVNLSGPLALSVDRHQIK